MSKRALILDDQLDRHRWFANELSLHGYQCDHAFNVDAAIYNLGSQQPYDLICLDHDLGEGMPTGMEVAHWMSENSGWDKEQCTVLIHSLNFPAGKTMAAKIPGAQHVPFYQLHQGKVKLR